MLTTLAEEHYRRWMLASNDKLVENAAARLAYPGGWNPEITKGVHRAARERGLWDQVVVAAIRERILGEDDAV